MNSPFQIDYKGSILKVEKHFVSNRNIFRVLFPNNQRPLLLVRAVRDNGSFFWTSVPEGRQSEAEIIGKLIQEYQSA
ncbi:MAG: hypothetical protein BGN92_07035 [Sphingobacteriales bacterium 41-5]|nr:MAG: hypothetical protein BGN92_07035 [Sphingobacteriales bacterium 41-5]